MNKNPLGDISNNLGDYLREQRESARLSVRQLSELAGVSNPYLSQIERGLKKPSADILQQIARGLQVSAESLYIRAGFLDPDEDEPRTRPSVVDAIKHDAALTSRQKSALIDIYESFIRVSDEEQPPSASTGAATEAPEHARTTAPTAGTGDDAAPSSTPARRTARRSSGTKRTTATQGASSRSDSTGQGAARATRKSSKRTTSTGRTTSPSRAKSSGRATKSTGTSPSTETSTKN